MVHSELTPREIRLLEAAKRLGVDAPMKDLAKLARLDITGAHMVRDRLRSMRRWPESKAEARP